MDAKTSNNPNSLAFENDSESSGSTTKPKSSLDCRVTTNNRKTNVKQKPPRKRLRTDDKPTKLSVEALTAKGTKKKLQTETETPSKEKSPNNSANINKLTEVPPPAIESPSATRKDNSPDRSVSSKGPSTSKQNNWSTLFTGKTSKADLEACYLQLDKLGEGGFGSVYAGKRIADNLPVAIKHIPKVDVESRTVVLNGRICIIPIEVLLMLRVAGGPESVGKSAAVSLLDWYNLDHEVLLVMERPVPSVDLWSYLNDNNGPLEEYTAKNIMKQLVEAAIKMHSDGVFHRDIKSENILIETSSDGPRVRIIDFGCGCVLRTKPYHSFSGTSAYAPPEFYRNRSYQAGPTTVWQLGAVLYEMLDGYKNFATSEILRKKIKISSELSQDCQDLLRRCLAEKPKDRATLEQMQLHPWFT